MVGENNEALASERLAQSTPSEELSETLKSPNFTSDMSKEDAESAGFSNFKTLESDVCQIASVLESATEFSTNNDSEAEQREVCSLEKKIPIQQRVVSVIPEYPQLTECADYAQISICSLTPHEEWEGEISTFTDILDNMLAHATSRELIQQTADYILHHPQHSIRFQLKLKQRAQSNEANKSFNFKIMLFYVLHEFFKHFQSDMDVSDKVQRQWYQTVEDILLACAREIKSADDGRKRLFKTLARWEELGLFPTKMKVWKSIVLGETKPKRGPIRLPKTEAERLAEYFAPDAEGSSEAIDTKLTMKEEVMTANVTNLNRSTCQYLFEQKESPKSFMMQHWRFTGIAYIEVLGQCLALGRNIILTACSYYHRIYNSGIYAQERYKVAAACVFLAAKAASKRMRLIRMVRTMHDILERPLMAGDEDILDMERLHLLHYEIQVLQAIDYELTIEMPFYHLRRILVSIPAKLADDITSRVNAIIDELFWLPLCLELTPHILAEAAVYIACEQADRIFSFKWCHKSSFNDVLTDKQARMNEEMMRMCSIGKFIIILVGLILEAYRSLCDWKRRQERSFNDLINCGREHGKDITEVFEQQQGGLRLDLLSVRKEEEYTKNDRHIAISTLRLEDTDKRGASSTNHRRQDHYTYVERKSGEAEDDRHKDRRQHSPYSRRERYVHNDRDFERRSSSCRSNRQGRTDKNSAYLKQKSKRRRRNRSRSASSRHGDRKSSRHHSTSFTERYTNSYRSRSVSYEQISYRSRSHTPPRTAPSDRYRSQFSDYSYPSSRTREKSRYMTSSSRSESPSREKQGYGRRRRRARR